MDPLPSDTRNETSDRKSEYLSKEQDSKTTIEPKKKPTDFKVKTEQKYQKTFKDDESKRGESNDAASSTVTTIPMSSSSSKPIEGTTARSMETMAITIPFLLRGEPIVTRTNVSIPVVESSTGNNFSSTKESSTEGVGTTEETTASRGRALNISAPEPTNSLHSNITDLSDVSMDDDDKEVEGEKVVRLSCLSFHVQFIIYFIIHYLLFFYRSIIVIDLFYYCIYIIYLFFYYFYYFFLLFSVISIFFLLLFLLFFYYFPHAFVFFIHLFIYLESDGQTQKRNKIDES